MIIGLGSDLIDIRRIERSLERHGHRFANRVFTKTEQEISDSRKQRAASYAKRFAAKEAFAKSLGTGFANSLNFKDITIINDKMGKPYFLINDN